MCTVHIVAMMSFSIGHEIFTIKAEYFLDTYIIQTFQSVYFNSEMLYIAWLLWCFNLLCLHNSIVGTVDYSRVNRYQNSCV